MRRPTAGAGRGRPEGTAASGRAVPGRAGRRERAPGPRQETGHPRREPRRVRLPANLDPGSLDPEVRNQLRPLARAVAEEVALRLVATAQLIDTDPEQALAHALVARQLASRIAPVREAAGLAAYHAGQWQAAIGELRTYHRMTGRQSHLAVIADCERALGRPERAIDLYRSADSARLTRQEAVELLIVAAGARADLGQRDAAVAMLQVPELGLDKPWAARLRYAYADALLAVGRREQAREWFARAAALDRHADTDAAERLLELDGVVLDERPDQPDLDGVVFDERPDEPETVGPVPGTHGQRRPDRPHRDPADRDRPDGDEDRHRPDRDEGRDRPEREPADRDRTDPADPAAETDLGSGSMPERPGSGPS